MKFASKFAVPAKVKLALCVLLTLSACHEPSWKSADRDAAECAMQAQRLYPHDTNAYDQSAPGPGLPLTYEQNCMTARGYRFDWKAGCDPGSDKQAMFKGACYSRM